MGSSWAVRRGERRPPLSARSSVSVAADAEEVSEEASQTSSSMFAPSPVLS